MGIPSYFSHIIRNYSNIIRSLKHFDEKNVKFQHLFMDCNSIVYDAVHSMEYIGDSALFESEIIKYVINKIEEYILSIKPTDTIFIAFDGVAPFAKMEQQRTRRHKTQFMADVNFDNNTTVKPKWNTTAITPGTEFMQKLSDSITYSFSFVESKYNVKKIIVSTSTEPGEGEHKLFNHMRKCEMKKDKIALYGLDSDLIMLSIFHLSYCDNIFVFREAPEFLKSSLPVDVNTNNNEPYFLDMKHLANSIISEMSCVDRHINRVYDYVFLCFFLGNDFLPHFPAMNIRTHGIDTLLTIYRNVIGKHRDTFIITENNTISWNNLRKVISFVSQHEKEYLRQEYSKRKKFDYYKFAETTPVEKDQLFQNTPIVYRSQEMYISPENDGWENRYYKTLFKKVPDEQFIKTVCNNYLEALEWVFLYYTKGCVNWRWKYNYHYPPLFKDLLRYMPHFETNFVSYSNEAAFCPQTQLSYVLPISSHKYLNSKIESFLNKNYKELYSNNVQFEWAFCRYFWEAHPILPTIDVGLLSQWDRQFVLMGK
jgi:5'-3' exonuclease